MTFESRLQAGRDLAEALAAYAGDESVVVLGLPRGGVVVAAEVARLLQAPLDIVLARKIGAPDNPELAIGAVTQDGTLFLNEEYVRSLEVDEVYLQSAAKMELEEIKKRVKAYRGGLPPIALEGKTVILVDDGIATGFTMKAAIAYIKSHRPLKMVVAVPVGPPDTIKELKKTVTEVVVLTMPAGFRAVGEFYEMFEQTTDEEVVQILKQFRAG